MNNVYGQREGVRRGGSESDEGEGVKRERARDIYRVMSYFEPRREGLEKVA